MSMYLLGFDIGSSSVKAAIVDGDSRKVIASAQQPTTEMGIQSPKRGWAEQDPELWWKYVCDASKMVVSKANIKPQEIRSIGLSYQMHGLVVVDDKLKVLRPSIIWCDSRASEIGRSAFHEIGPSRCLSHLLNSPGNFTASKLKWVKEEEPANYSQVSKFMLPGDFIAMKMTGTISTTIPGLSEAMLWDFKTGTVADFLMDYYGLDPEQVPEIIPTISNHGKLTDSAAESLGLHTEVIVSYRAGDQPNNALSLGVVNPGEVAATGGTSGVVYGVTNQAVFDKESRVNGFAHVNYSVEDPKIGLLLCINGAGIQYSWLKHQFNESDYNEMEHAASQVPANSDGLRIIPFGNGAERILHDADLGTTIINLQLNRHSKKHIFRAALEGIAFAYKYGMEIFSSMHIEPELLRVGNDNLFRSAIFSSTIADLLNCTIDVVDTTGAVGAALAAGVEPGIYSNLDQAVGAPETIQSYYPTEKREQYLSGYQSWKQDLTKLVNTK